jgi:prolyl oligopeptidase
MIPKNSVLRVARPTDNLSAIALMYVDGLGFALLSEFHDADFDGAIIGHPNHPYHLEFTHHKGTSVGKAPTQDNLLVFYVPEQEAWLECCARLLTAGFKQVVAYNEYWDQRGKTFEDRDGYRIVIERDTWKK